MKTKTAPNAAESERLAAELARVDALLSDATKAEADVDLALGEAHSAAMHAVLKGRRDPDADAAIVAREADLAEAKRRVRTVTDARRHLEAALHAAREGENRDSLLAEIESRNAMIPAEVERLRSALVSASSAVASLVQLSAANETARGIVRAEYQTETDARLWNPTSGVVLGDLIREAGIVAARRAGRERPGGYVDLRLPFPTLSDPPLSLSPEV